MSEMRWNPLLREWVVTATHRQQRTYKPPKEYCPLCPTEPGAFPTEVPSSEYEIVVFENRFPSFRTPAPEPDVVGSEFYRVAPAAGVCEVVLYSSEHDKTIADLSVEHIERLVEVWTDRFRELGEADGIEYVLIFENRGDAVGVTLHHPHGQIYAFPFVPPIPRRELEAAAEHRSRTGRCLVCDIVRAERQGEGIGVGVADGIGGAVAKGIADGIGGQPGGGPAKRRVIFENEDFVSYVPYFARYPFEVHLSAKAHRESLLTFSAAERTRLAEAIKAQVTAYDRLFGFTLPYMMIMHQAPAKDLASPDAHFHIEFYPLNRSEDKLKYLAGCESGAGTFITDMAPEHQAERLRAGLGQVN